MYLEPPIFTLPVANVTLWRYMDFTKFIDLLDKQALFFARADKFKDSLEGLVTEANMEMRAFLNQPAIKPYLSDKMKEQVERDPNEELRKWRPHILVSCWHESRSENHDMWDQFGDKQGKKGIVVTTDYKSLRESLKFSSQIYIGLVQYVDEWNLMSEPSLYTIFSHKRREFEQESEVRAIAISAGVPAVGAHYEVDPSILVKKVFVAPYAEDGFKECVEAVAKCYGLDASVCKSALTANNP